MRPEQIFPACFSLLDDEQQRLVLGQIDPFVPNDFAFALANFQNRFSLPPYILDLAKLESCIFDLQQKELSEIPLSVDRLSVNPALQLLRLNWNNLVSLLPGREAALMSEPSPEEELILIYRRPITGEIVTRAAGQEDLLALKMVIEQLTLEAVAEEGNFAVGVIDRVLDRAVGQGILLRPPSRIIRDPRTFPKGKEIAETYFSSPVFTLQWHITQICDLHCKHCYDRSDRVSLSLARGLSVLDDLRGFCLSHHARGQVSFSGGNPLLHPHFLELYQGAVDRNLMVAILGNPASRGIMEKIIAIRIPEFFQVSLEGLAEHNDFIRGKGHFARTMEFLDLLNELGVYAMVMLTLTRGNMDQVLVLADILRNRADLFTFNRLAMVGEGANLQPPDQSEYANFLRRYIAAAEGNACMSRKDNLINIILDQEKKPLFGGCTGHGCGAAFNFISLLPDGEVHACRKFPSYIGNAFDQRLSAIYHGEKAQQYRDGTAACIDCPIRPVCGGCMAITHGFGRDVFKEKDPNCFFQGVKQS
jgi:selenobiotic family peptide radical SAM maturase